MAASQSRTVHSETQSVWPFHTGNIGPISPKSGIKPSHWIEPLPNGELWYAMDESKSHCTRKWLCPNHVWYIPRTTGSVLSTKQIWDPSVHYPVLYNHFQSSPYQTRMSEMPRTVQRTTVPGKWPRPNHVRYIPRPKVSALSTQELLDRSVHHPILDNHIKSSPYPKAGLIYYARIKELLYPSNGCVLIPYGIFQDSHSLSYPQKKYWTHQPIIQYFTITLNWALSQQGGLIYHALLKELLSLDNGCISKAYGTFQGSHGLSHVNKNIGPIGPLSRSRSSPWIEPLPNGEVWYSMHDSKIYCSLKWLRSNQVRHIPRSTRSVLSTKEIWDPSDHYPVLDHHCNRGLIQWGGLKCH